MSKNYEALHHIQKQLSDYDSNISNAIQRLFNIEDQIKQCQGCVIDSVVVALIFKKYGIDVEFHLGEMCYDGQHDAYHCWLTLECKILDMGIYGNSNYNPYFHGEKMMYPLIFEDVKDIKYVDGSTEEESWLSQLGGMCIMDYIKICPQNRVFKLFCQSLDITEDKFNQEMMYGLAKDMKFPVVKKINSSPSGRTGI